MCATATSRERLGRILFGPPGPSHAGSRLTLLTFFVLLLFAAFQHVEVLMGLVERQESNLLSAYYLTGGLVFYVLVRTGLARRLSSDATLTVPQMVFATTAVTWSYAITGPARGAVIGIMILVMLFGVFQMKRKVALRVTLLGFTMLAGAMAWRAWLTPERYDPRVEFIHFMFAAIVMGATATLATWFGALRERLARQRAELAQALELNRELATRDALTGLLNRRAASELLAREHPRIQRGQGPLALALLDIDHFKRINDEFGHEVGDAVLKRFASCLGAQLRAADALARWGGEEFLLVMPGTELHEAMVVMTRLRAALADAGLVDLLGPAGVTFSAGLVACQSDESQDAAVARADRALYRAKHLGRNRVETDPPPTPQDLAATGAGEGAQPPAVNAATAPTP